MCLLWNKRQIEVWNFIVFVGHIKVVFLDVLLAIFGIAVESATVAILIFTRQIAVP